MIEKESVQSKLERLVKEGFVLHGSPVNSEILLPQEPRGQGGPGKGKCPAGVYATTKPRLALFYAVVRQATPGRGYVYICPPDSFQVRSNIELYSPVAVKPIMQIPVGIQDFTRNKTIFEAINEILTGKYV